MISVRPNGVVGPPFPLSNSKETFLSLRTSAPEGTPTAPLHEKVRPTRYNLGVTSRIRDILRKSETFRISPGSETFLLQEEHPSP